MSRLTNDHNASVTTQKRDPATRPVRVGAVARPAKRHRVMTSTEDGQAGSRGQEAGSNGSISQIIDLFTRFKSMMSYRPISTEDSVPVASTSTASSQGSFSSSQQYHRHAGHLRDTQSESTTMNAIEDMSHEPDDEIMFMSPPYYDSRRTQGQRNTLPLSPSSSGLNGQLSRRQEPMFHAETQQRKKERKDRRLKALAGLDAQWRSRPPASSSSSTSASTSTVNTTTASSLSGIETPTYSSFSSANRPIDASYVARHAGPSQNMRHYPGNSFGTSMVGLNHYRRMVDQNQYGPAANIGSIFAPSSYPYRASDNDILAQRRVPPVQSTRDSAVEHSLEIARLSISTPKPKPGRLKAYSKSKLKDEALSEQIEDLTRRKRKWPDRMPEENVKIIRAALRTPGVVSSLPAAEVSQKDLVKLAPGEWLNDEVINFYGVMVNLRSAEATKRREKGFPREGDEDLLDVHVFSSFFFSKLASAGYSGVRKWTKKFDFFKKDIVIMPVNLGNAHWVCAAINVRLQRFEYYDSMGNVNYNVLDKLREYVKAEHQDKKGSPINLDSWINYHNPKTPQQANGYDCGVFTSQFIECLSRREGYFDFEQKHMTYLRQKMIHEIKLMQLSPEEWFDPNA